jgi:hypothetical protein
LRDYEPFVVRRFVAVARQRRNELRDYEPFVVRIHRRRAAEAQ